MRLVLRQVGQRLSTFAIALLHLRIAGAQTTNTSLFTFADLSPTIADSATKVFQTTISLTPASPNQSAFDENVFLNASREFYSSAFSGFMSTAVLLTSVNTDENNQSVESFDVFYEVSYDYDLFSAQNVDDSLILNRIGSNLLVRNGLEASQSFKALYNVTSNSSSFSLSGNLLCPSASCPTSYVTCRESALGLSPVCSSVCFDSFVCQNSGTCVHRSPDRTPTCNCLASSSVWYLGGRCEYEVQAWMIAVFVVGFLCVILLIILIGFLCCRKKSKSRDRDRLTENPPKRQERGAPKANSPSLANNKPREEPQGFMVEAETLPLSPGTPITSNALVTVQESSESDSATDIDEQTNAAIENSFEQRNTQIVEASINQSAISAQSSDDSSSSEEAETLPDVIVTEVSPRSSVADSEVLDRRYNSLQFPDTRHRNSEAPSRGYDTLDASTRNRGTQTNTRINIELPESILMNKI